jgi:hypothetical protein
MTLSRTFAVTIFGLVTSLTLLSGCGGANPEVDNAEVIKTEPPKPAVSTPTAPPASPTPDAPKG